MTLCCGHLAQRGAFGKGEKPFGDFGSAEIGPQTFDIDSDSMSTAESDDRHPFGVRHIKLKINSAGNICKTGFAVLRVLETNPRCRNIEVRTHE